MNKSVFLTLFILLFALSARAQSCLPDGIVFHSQLEIDSFPAKYPGCTIIQGGVRVEDWGILNIDSLRSITEIGGDLIITSNLILDNLNGLANLTHVGGDLTVESNPFLASIEGLSALSSVGGNMLIYSTNINSLHGLQNLHTVSGNLSFGGLANIQTLAGLDNLSSVGMNLNVYGCAIHSLSGLNALTTVGKDLTITYNTNMTSLNGLNALTSVGGDLEIADYNTWAGNELHDLSGLDNLVTVGKTLTLAADTYSLHLGKLKSVGKVVLINEYITNLEELSTLESSQEGIGLFYCFAIKDLSGLSKLSRLNGLDLNNVLNITSLKGLEKFDTLTGHVILRFNNSLTSLYGLHNIRYFDGDVLIENNYALSDCSIEPICKEIIPANKLYLSNNAPGCKTLEELPDNCHFPIEITVLWDTNNNCLPDSADTPAPNVQAHLSNFEQTALGQTDTAGIARLSTSRWDFYTLDLPDYPNGNWAVCQDSILTDPPGLLDTLRQTFLLQAFTECPELELSLGLPSFFRGCLVNSEIKISVQNRGTALAEGVKVAFVKPSGLEMLSAIPSLTGQSGDTIYFELGNVLPFGAAEVKMTVKTDCNAFLIDQTLCVEAFASLENPCPNTLPAFSEIKLSATCMADTLVRFTLKNIGDAPTLAPHEYRIIRNNTVTGPPVIFSLNAHQSIQVDVPADGATWRMEATKFNNGTQTAIGYENCGGLTPGLITAYWQDQGPLDYDFGCRQVIGSFDPNLKSAVPTGVNGNIQANQPLQYTIDFQNTGSDTAFRVLLRDVLPLELDLTSFRPLLSSHPNTWELRGNTLEVLFSPIALPDSNTNESASHGFFSFEINQKPDLPEGTYFQNTASIIFDFNPTIETNTVWHRIGQLTVKVDEPQTHADLWQVLGNPTNDAATFRAGTFNAGEKRFELFDASGHMLRSAQFSGQEFVFQRDSLPSGVYCFRIIDAINRVFAGKIVVTE